jgi:subfamily B ATP-binding cassette protein MsbA
MLRPHGRTIIAMVSATLVQMAMALAVPWPLKSVLDNVIGNHPAPLWISWLLPVLGGDTKVHIAEAAALLTVAIATITGVAMYAGSYLTESLGQSIGNELRVRLYHHLQELSLAYYDSTRVGSLLSTLTGDVQTIQAFASSSTLTILTDTLSLIAMVVVMLWLRWDFALIALAATPLLAAFVLRVNKAVRTAVKEVRTSQSDLLATLQEDLQSIEVIIAFTREDRQEQQLQQAGLHTATAWLQARKASALLAPIVTLAIAVCTALVLWRGSLLVLTGVMTIGSLSIFLAYLARFFTPVRDLAQMTNTIAGVSVAFQRVTAICDADIVISERPTPRQPAPFRGEIAFENVAFAYRPDVPVLRDITFDVHPGQMVGIVGPTGGGKSTVLSMIARFRDPGAGRICIDGVDIRNFRLHGLRTQIGFVLQETVLLHGTVADNIAFGRPHATEDQIVRAAQLANADEFISRMPNGYDSMIGDRGATLSGGQRQHRHRPRIDPRQSHPHPR